MRMIIKNQVGMIMEDKHVDEYQLQMTWKPSTNSVSNYTIYGYDVIECQTQIDPIYDEIHDFYIKYDPSSLVTVKTNRVVTFTVYDPEVASVPDYIFDGKYYWKTYATGGNFPFTRLPAPEAGKERMAEILEQAADRLLVDGWTQGKYHRSKNKKEYD